LNLSIERSWVPFRCWVLLFLMGFTSFGFRARFLVQVCLSFNIFHSFVSSLAAHIIYLFLAEFSLPYCSIFVCSCSCLNYWSSLTSSSYFEIFFHYSQKLVANPKKKKKEERERDSKKKRKRSSTKKKKNEKRDRLIEEEERKKKKRERKKKYYFVLPNFQTTIFFLILICKIPYSLCSNMKFLH
jgi:hypothetical protein